MFTYNIVFFITALSVQPNILTKADLREDAINSFGELTAVMLEAIVTATNELYDLGLDIEIYITDTKSHSEVDFDQQSLTLVEGLADLKNAAELAQKNISSCLVSENRLTELSGIYFEKVNSCISEVALQFEQMLNDTTYLVGNSMDKEYHLADLFNRCATDDNACFSDIISQIADGIELWPLEIKAQLTGANENFDVTKVQIRDCADLGLAGFIHDGNALLAEISECVNKILS